MPIETAPIDVDVALVDAAPTTMPVPNIVRELTPNITPDFMPEVTPGIIDAQLRPETSRGTANSLHVVGEQVTV